MSLIDPSSRSLSRFAYMGIELKFVGVNKKCFQGTTVILIAVDLSCSNKACATFVIFH